MFVGTTLKDLEARIAQCQPDPFLAPVADTCSQFETYADLYQLPKQDAHTFKHALTLLADENTFTARDAGRALYALNLTFFTAQAAHGAGKLLEDYTPARQVASIIRDLPEWLRRLPAAERDAYLDTLCRECRDLSSMSNPMARLSRIQRMIELPHDNQRSLPPYGLRLRKH
jgi:hypothetical protein